MVTDTPELTAILFRLERVEKQNGRLKKIGYAVALVVLVVLVMGQTRPGRMVEAEQFILRDQSGKNRAQLGMDASGTPALDFFDESGKREAEYRGGDLMLLGKEGFVLMSGEHLTISTGEGHIDLQTNPLRLYIVDERNGYGYVALGMAPSISSRHAIDAALILSGNKGRGFAEVAATAEGSHLHLEPGMSEGKVLPGGMVDITSEGPLMQIADQQGLTAGIGRGKLKDKQTGETARTSTASITLATKDKVLWSVP